MGMRLPQPPINQRKLSRDFFFLMMVGLYSWFTLGLWFLAQGVVEINGQKWSDRIDRTKPDNKIPKIQTNLTSAYFYPFTCALVYTDQEFLRGGKDNATFVSACGILSPHWVVTSLYNLDLKWQGSYYRYFQDVGKLKVVAGSIFATPSRGAKGLYNLKESGVEKIVTYVNSDFAKKKNATTPKIEFKGPPSSATVLMDTVKLLVKDSYNYKFQWELAYLKLKKSFSWTPFVLPLPLVAETHSDLQEKTKGYLKKIEMGSIIKCNMAGFTKEQNKIAKYELTVVKFDECQSTWCYGVDKCVFPDPFMHVCLMSDGTAEVAARDQGSPVYCDGLGKSIFAVLAVAPPRRSPKPKPGVYTLINHVIHGYENTGTAEKITLISRSSHTLAPDQIPTWKGHYRV